MSAIQGVSRGIAIVTGGTKGIGRSVCFQLAALGYDVIAASRDEAAGAEVSIEAERRSLAISYKKLDLASLDSVASFSKQIPAWNVLVNNAGIKIEQNSSPTRDGFERHMQINHLGHFLLTAKLWPAAATNASVVSVSSIVANRIVDPLLPGRYEQVGRYDPAEHYGNSKFLNLAFASALDQRTRKSGVTSAAAAPGFTRAEPYGPRYVRHVEKLFAQSCDYGALPITTAALTKRAAYWVPKYFQLWGQGKAIQFPRILTGEVLDKIWEASEEALGISFDPVQGPATS